MGKPDIGDRIVQVLVLLVLLVCLGNGLMMLMQPFEWYLGVPGVSGTGPANAHFIRDIGLAYIGCAVLLGYGLPYPSGRWLALVAGALWLSVHGMLHVWEVATGLCSVERFWGDVPGVLGPPLVVWLALGILFARQRVAPAGLPKALVIGAIDRMNPDEAGLFVELATAPGHAFEKFAHFMPASQHRHCAPAPAFHMARIAAVLSEDCGPCALTAAQGALADGVDRALVNSALAGGAELQGEAALGFAYGHVVATHADDAFAMGDAVEAALGRAARLEMALTVALVRAYPASKRGLGLSRACGLHAPQV